MSLAKNLKRLIDSRSDLRSPSDFAKKAGITKQTINSIIRGKVKQPNASTLDKIVNYFNCSIDEIIEPINSSVSERLYKLMADNSISNNQLSKKVGIGRDQISRILNKKVINPTDNTLNPIAHYFNVPVDYFRS